MRESWVRGLLLSALMLIGYGCTPEDQPACDSDGDCTGDGQICESGACVVPPCEEGDTRACGVGGGFVCVGTQVCTDGVFGACEAPPEICDGIDNDCDRRADEGFAGLGDACGAGEGECADVGAVICSADGLGTVCDARAGEPADERCDGFDNDCDGATDEDLGGGACDTGRFGVCAAGAEVCTAGDIICVADTEATDEICDSIDNDCDGQIDEARNGGPLAEPCYEGPAGTEGVGPCAAGVRVCTDGLFGACADQALPGAEICDGADNDCNGAVDDRDVECVCAAGAQRPCYSGPEGTVGVGVCAAGTQICADDGSAWGACEGEVGPSVELCDGEDDDCNGVVDDAVGVGGICEAGVGACAAQAVRICDLELGQVVCPAEAGLPADELCNGVDDDCNGRIDDVEGVGAACEAGLGACAEVGLLACDPDGEVRCTARPGNPTDEVCNDVDDDCDGVVDDVDGLGEACEVGVGLCASTGVVVCGADSLECGAVPNPPQREICTNGIDENCNGEVDDDLLCGDCGNGQRDRGEQCDDGNRGDGDGCDNACRVEEGFECFDGPEDTPVGVDGRLCDVWTPVDVPAWIGGYGVAYESGSVQFAGGQARYLAGYAVLTTAEDGEETELVVGYRDDGRPREGRTAASAELLAIGSFDRLSGGAYSVQYPDINCGDNQGVVNVEFRTLDACRPVVCAIDADCLFDGEACVEGRCERPGPFCGDGEVGADEGCDDGNGEDGDGCSAACAVEPGFACEDFSFAFGVRDTFPTPGHVAPQWNVSEDGRAIVELTNSWPAHYASDLPISPDYISLFEIVVNSDADDDSFGWAIGGGPTALTAPGAPYLLFDWRGGDAIDPDLGEALAGLRVDRVVGPPSGNDLAYSTGPVESLARATTLGRTPWVHRQTYTIGIIGDRERLRVYVDGELEFDLRDVPLGDGRLGLYASSQPGVRAELVEPVTLQLCRPTEVCDSGVDDDGDGAIDCDDPDCAGDVACQSSCPAQDAFEPNDDRASATVITPGVYPGLAACGEVDAFTFDICPRGTYEIEAMLSEGSATYDLYLNDNPDPTLTDQDNRRQTGRASPLGTRVTLVYSGTDAVYDLDLVIECAEICDSGVDDDGDGAIDCDDADCAEDPACAVVAEVCDSGVDDDGDGAIDCDDPDCAGDPACQPACPRQDDFEPNDDRASATVITPGIYPGLAACDEVDAFTFDICPRGTYEIEAILSSGSVTYDLYLNDNPEPTLADQDNRRQTGRASPLGTRVTLVYSGTDAVYDLDLVIECAEICDSGVDDDGDGAIDCDDADCAEDPACAVVAEVCDSGVDEDGDGAIDCDDPDCAGDVVCQSSCPAQDAFEPNNNRFSATNIAPGFYPGLEACNEVDAFTFDVCPRGQFAIEAMLSEGTMTFDLYINDLPDPIVAGQANERLEGAGSPSGSRITMVYSGTDAAYDLELVIDCGEICDNQIDDNGDGAIDCDEPSCANTPGCPVAAEICDNGLDEDGDGVIDCDDPNCAGDPVCAEPERCAGDDRFEPNGAEADATPLVPGSYPDLFWCGPDDTGDWYAVDVCAGGRLTVTAAHTAADGNIQMALFRAVDGAAPVQLHWALTATDDEVIENINSGEAFQALIRVDGEASNTYGLEVAIDGCGEVREVCDSGADDDGDGLADCADPDCGRVPACFCAVDDPFESDTLRETLIVPGARLTDMPLCADEYDQWTLYGCPAANLVGEVENTIFIAPDGFPIDVADRFISENHGIRATLGESHAILTNLVGIAPEGCDPGEVPAPIGRGGLDLRIAGVLTDGDPTVAANCDGPAEVNYQIVRITNPEPTEEVVTITADFRDAPGNLAVFDEPFAGPQLLDECPPDPAVGYRGVVMAPGTTLSVVVFNTRGDAPANQFVVRVTTDGAGGEICGNGGDDDGDGAVDCDDPDCAADPACIVAGAEVCNSGFDDNGDGAADCGDPQCAASPLCTEPPTCPADDRYGIGLVTNPTQIGPGTFDGLIMCEGNSEIFMTLLCPGGRLTAEATGSKRFELDLSTPSRNVLPFASSGDTPVGATARVEVVNDDPVARRVRVVIADYFAIREDDPRLVYDLEVRIDGCPPVVSRFEDCRNNVDDDGNGAVDCADPSCAAAESCIAEICDSGIDEDGDDWIGCNDPECRADPACTLADQVYFTVPAAAGGGPPGSPTSLFTLDAVGAPVLVNTIESPNGDPNGIRALAHDGQALWGLIETSLPDGRLGMLAGPIDAQSGTLQVAGSFPGRQIVGAAFNGLGELWMIDMRGELIVSVGLALDEARTILLPGPAFFGDIAFIGGDTTEFVLTASEGGPPTMYRGDTATGLIEPILADQGPVQSAAGTALAYGRRIDACAPELYSVEVEQVFVGAFDIATQGRVTFEPLPVFADFEPSPHIDAANPPRVFVDRAVPGCAGLFEACVGLGDGDGDGLDDCEDPDCVRANPFCAE